MYTLDIQLELQIVLRIAIAALLGGVIGFEREMKNKRPGLRTHMLIALGAALFVSFTELFVQIALPFAPPGPIGNFRIQVEPTSVVQAIVTGITFLGAGAIFFSDRHHRVHGLTTAASIWVTAAMGIAVGLQAYVLAVGTTLLAIFILHVLHRFDLDEDEQLA